MSSGKEQDSDVDELQFKICNTDLQRTRTSEVWQYFGYKKKLDGKIVDDKHYYCRLCFENDKIFKVGY